jgi:hypothetical protein
MLPPVVERSIERYLSHVDRLLPGRVTGFYVVGSTALGAYRERRSDIDFVAVVDGDLGPAALRRLRAQHAWSAAGTGTTALRRGRSPLTGTCNGCFIRADDLGRPATEITPVASHVGHTFKVGVGDISPVDWKVLAERGIAVRGPDPESMPLDPQLDLMLSWNLGNIEQYWRPWAERAMRTPGRFRLRPRWSTAWGVLGAPRLHRSIATGDVISKEDAGDYAPRRLPRPLARAHPRSAGLLAGGAGEPAPVARRTPPAHRRVRPRGDRRCPWAGARTGRLTAQTSAVRTPRPVATRAAPGRPTVVG